MFKVTTFDQVILRKKGNNYQDESSQKSEYQFEIELGIKNILKNVENAIE